MSVADELSREEVVEYVKMFPLGRTREQIHENFDTDAVDDILDELEEEGVILHSGGKFRWTG